MQNVIPQATTNVLEKQLGTSEARRNFASVIDEVKQGYKYVIKEHGKDVAAVVPLAVYESWKKDRAAFFTLLHEMQDTSNLPEEEAMQYAIEAVQAVRAETT